MEEQLDDKLDQFQQRLEDYLRQGESKPPETDPTLQHLREELSVFTEELQVAIADLRQKNLELAQSRNQLEAERARYQELFDFAPDGYLVTDAQGIIREANQAAAAMLNLSPKYLVGKPLALYVADDERNSFRTWLLHLGEAESDLQTERRDLLLRPRHKPPLEVGMTVVRSFTATAGQEHQLRWMIHDISELKHMQRSLQQARDELEMHVEKRTSQLAQANAELAQTNRQLEAKNHELQEFAFIASHDLQEPLRKIKAFGEQLLRRPMDETGRDFLDRMIDASMRMQVMLDGLLEYARINYTGETFSEINLTTLAQEVITDLEYRTMLVGGTVETVELPALEADPSQIYRLFQNLIANGLKFHRPDTTPQVRITGEDLGSEVLLRFEDNGVGFDDRFREKLFMPFSRLHGRSKFEGSGMGLAICRKIVERHGGRIDAEGHPNQGAVFTVVLPKKQSV